MHQSYVRPLVASPDSAWGGSNTAQIDSEGLLDRPHTNLVLPALATMAVRAEPYLLAGLKYSAAADGGCLGPSENRYFVQRTPTRIRYPEGLKEHHGYAHSTRRKYM